MGKFRIDRAERADLATAFNDESLNYYEVDADQLDSVGDQKESSYQISDFGAWLGYYRVIPELAAAIDAKARWTVGKGFSADEITTLILDRVTGWGKDTFNTILENCVRTYHIAGDSFCEIITDDDGFLINLKPLDPGTIKIIVNRKGRIIRYEQTNKVGIKHKTTKIFQPNEIFHLSRNRLGDEMHGQSIIPQVEEIILMRNEAMADWRRVLHRNVDPVRIYHLDTDNASEIADFKAKMDATRGKGENIYVPKGAVEITPDTIAPNATLNPIAWIESLNRYFFQVVGVPQIVVGGGTAITDAAAKTEYLAWEQTIEEEQLFLEEQVLAQLNLVIELEFPASLEVGALSSKPKVEERGAEPMEQAAQPNDMRMEMEGRK